MVKRVESACCSGRPPSAVVVQAADRIKKRAAKGSSRRTGSKQAGSSAKESLPKWSGGRKNMRSVVYNLHNL